MTKSGPGEGQRQVLKTILLIIYQVIPVFGHNEELKSLQVSRHPTGMTCQ